jgi:hypothetical protein
VARQRQACLCCPGAQSAQEANPNTPLLAAGFSNGITAFARDDTSHVVLRRKPAERCGHLLAYSTYRVNGNACVRRMVSLTSRNNREVSVAPLTLLRTGRAGLVLAVLGSGLVFMLVTNFSRRCAKYNPSTKHTIFSAQIAIL